MWTPMHSPYILQYIIQCLFIYLCMCILCVLCFCLRAARIFLHIVMQTCSFPRAGVSKFSQTFMLTCGTIYLSSLIWFDCILPASVSANSSQCDSVVCHKVMKTHKALITCQLLRGWADSRPLCSQTHTGEKTHRCMLLHTIQSYTHLHTNTATHTYTQAWGVLQFKLPRCHQALIDGSFSHGRYMISCYWPCLDGWTGWFGLTLWSSFTLIYSRL